MWKTREDNSLLSTLNLLDDNKINAVNEIYLHVEKLNISPFHAIKKDERMVLFSHIIKHVKQSRAHVFFQTQRG